MDDIFHFEMDNEYLAKVHKIWQKYAIKRTRLSMEGYSERLLPQRVGSVNELLREHYTKRDLDRTLNQMQEFNKRGSETLIETAGGAKISKFEYNLIKSEKSRLKGYYSKDVNRLTDTVPKIAGKKQDRTFAEMGDSTLTTWENRRDKLGSDIDRMSQGELNKFKDFVYQQAYNKRVKDYQFRENWWQMIETSQNSLGADKEKLEAIKQRTMALPVDKFIKLFEEDLAFKALINTYGNIQHPKVAQRGQSAKRHLSTFSNQINEIYQNLDEIMKDYE